METNLPKEAHSLLREAHKKLDVIKTHMPKIIIGVAVIFVVIAVAHTFLGHPGMMTHDG